MRDVAGLIRSFDYAVATAARRRAATSQRADERRYAILERFRTVATAAFLEAYQETQEAAPRRWISQDAEADLLDLFLLQKAAYEVTYEAANRTAWLPIPLRGLAAMAQRIPAKEPTLA